MLQNVSLKPVARGDMAPLLWQGMVLASGGPMHHFLINRLNMVKIELLSYFGTVCTSSTETVFFLSSDGSKRMEH